MRREWMYWWIWAREWESTNQSDVRILLILGEKIMRSVNADTCRYSWISSNFWVYQSSQDYYSAYSFIYSLALKMGLGFERFCLQAGIGREQRQEQQLQSTFLPRFPISFPHDDSDSEQDCQREEEEGPSQESSSSSEKMIQPSLQPNYINCFLFCYLQRICSALTSSGDGGGTKDRYSA